MQYNSCEAQLRAELSECPATRKMLPKGELWGVCVLVVEKGNYQT